MLAICVAVVLQSASQRVPQALLRFEQAHSQLRTGRVSCVVTGGPAIVAMPTTRYRMELAKNGDVLWAYDADPEGVFSRDEFGNPQQLGGAQTLVKSGVAYHKAAFEFHGTIAEPGTFDRKSAPFFWGMRVDPRTIGMAPKWDDLVGQEPNTVLSNVTKGSSGFLESREGTVHRVTIQWPDGAEMVYEIDESKGWNATRISGSSRGGPWECVIDLAEHDGIWFPRRATLYRNGEMRTDLEVVEASFNTKDAPAGWTPADIGFEVGMGVEVKSSAGRSQAKEAWDGEKPVSHDEMFRRLNSGELQPGPTLKRLRKGRPSPDEERLERLRSSTRVVEAFISDWERHVAVFCHHYRLDQDQIEKAWRCLRHAQELANRYLDRSRDKFAALERRRDSREVSNEAVREEFAKLRKPIDDLFANELKPCLEKIPTRQQREAVERREKPAQQPTSQPVRPSPP